MNKKGLFLLGFAEGANLPLMAKAIYYSFELHKGQKRNDGTDYIDHPFDTCIILINNGVTDEVTLVTGLLHDTKEDTGISYSDLLCAFGDDVADRVSSLTKEKGISLDLYFANIKDPREVLVKTADRMHNMNDMAKCLSRERLEKYIKET